MKNKGLLIATLLIIAGLFYWFQVRPSNIRKACYSEVEEKYKSSGSVRKENLNLTFGVCLTRNGMKAEDFTK